MRLVPHASPKLWSLENVNAMVQNESSDVEWNEAEWLTECALRFHFYAYCDAVGKEWEQVSRHCLELALKGEFDQLSSIEKLCAFFFLQRLLFKWGWDRLPGNSAPWNTFRSLFLMVCHEEVPADFRDPVRYKTWQRDFEPRLEQGIKLVERIHQETHYEPWSGEF